jgi:hypothetical protein
MVGSWRQQLLSGEWVMVISDPILTLELVCPIEYLSNDQFDFAHWYRVRFVEFLRMAREHIDGTYGYSPEDILESSILWNNDDEGLDNDRMDDVDNNDDSTTFYSFEESTDGVFDLSQETNCNSPCPSQLMTDLEYEWRSSILEEGRDTINLCIDDSLSNQDETIPDCNAITNMPAYQSYYDSWWVSSRMRSWPHSSVPATRYPTSDTSPQFNSEEALELPMHTFAAKVKSQPPEGSYPSLQRNAARTKVSGRKIPRPVVVKVHVNGHECRALLDSGSLGDFMSTTLAEQLKVKKEPLESQLIVQLAAQGSKTKVNCYTMVKLQYGCISAERCFDIMNVDGYDLILGTPFIWQHKIMIGLNPARIVIGSEVPEPLINGEGVGVLASRAAQLKEEGLESIRSELREYASPLFQKASETELPPLRRINHRIPIKDKEKRYPFRVSKCPEGFREQWNAKRDVFLKSGRWQYAQGTNAAPIMFLRKPSGGMRNTVDLRARNDNTEKIASPLPDQEGIRRRVAGSRYFTAMDLEGAYEQVRVEPEDVPYTLMNTPDGTMVSLVLQQGDCNAISTFMSVMTDMFSAYIGVWLEIYLDDLIVHGNDLADHVKHVKIVIDTLRKNKFYLAESKMHFLADEIKLLGHIITHKGIYLDPLKVDKVAAWKVPTNRDLLRGFLGAVGYLADGCQGIRIPMDVLNRLTGDTVVFRWGPTEQRAFDQIKEIVNTHRNVHRIAMRYGQDAAPVHMVTDGCLTGIGGCIKQGTDWKTAPVVAFYSAKLSSAQQNYAVHEIELLAGLETMMRHRDILLGVQFTWYTDHKALTHFLEQKNLSGRQARWLEKMSEFDFSVNYVPGLENDLADSLSRMYSAESAGVIRSPEEYVQFDENEPRSIVHDLPVLTGLEARAVTRAQYRGTRMPTAIQPKEPRVTSPVAQMEGAPATLVPTAQDAVEENNAANKGKNRAIEPAETGRPETAKEFSKRIKKVTLRLPGERQEGGSIDKLALDPRCAEPLGSTADPQAYTEPELDLPTWPTEASGTEEDAEASRVTEIEAVVSPDLIEVLSEYDGAHNFPSCLKGKFEEDSFFKNILSNPSQFKNFECEDGIVYLKEFGTRLLCIPDCMIGKRKAREIVITRAHSILAHLGPAKTTAYLRGTVWWKSLIADVRAYCESCRTCRRSKPDNQKPYGLLNPLPVPTNPWEAIGIDFVGPLPDSSNRDGTYDEITVIIDLLTGRVHLVPSRQDYRAREIAELVFSEVYRLHGLPKRIVSDRDVLFTSTFWQHLNQLLGIKLNMSSAYHPESDGSTERANRTVTQMIRSCINADQKNWVSKLPAVEFAINSARSESTGYAPFFLDTGRMPRSMIWDKPAASEYPGVRVFAQKMKAAIMAAHDAILDTRVKQTRSANRNRRPAPFAEGDMVYISTKNILFPKGRARKFVPKYIGPYLIEKDFGNNSFRVQLPSRLLQRGIHPVFHSSLMRVHVPNDDRLFPGRAENQIADFGDKGSEWAVDRILSHKGKGRSAVFEVRWKAGDITWLPLDRVDGLEQLKLYLDAQGVQSVGALSEGRGKPPLDDPQVYAGSMRLSVDKGQRRRASRSRRYKRRTLAQNEQEPSQGSCAVAELFAYLASLSSSMSEPNFAADIMSRTATAPSDPHAPTAAQPMEVDAAAPGLDEADFEDDEDAVSVASLGTPRGLSTYQEWREEPATSEDFGELYDAKTFLILAKGIGFDTKSCYFFVHQWPKPAGNATPYIAISYSLMRDYTNYDNDIRNGAVTNRTPTPHGYDEIQTFFDRNVSPIRASFSWWIHEAASRTVFGPSPVPILFTKDVVRAYNDLQEPRRDLHERIATPEASSSKGKGSTEGGKVPLGKGSKAGSPSMKKPYDEHRKKKTAVPIVLDDDVVQWSILQQARMRMYHEKKRDEAIARRRARKANH